MPVPSRERVIELLADRAPGDGYDVEDVTVSRAGAHSVVKVIVDRDEGFELDAIAELSRSISDLLDATDEFGETSYNLEVTTPGVERPLTEPRHWRRARARKVSLRVNGDAVDGRVGSLSDDESAVDLVVRGRSGPDVRTVSLADVTDAVVQVEFKPPNARELELAGGVLPGRAASGDDTDPTDLTEGTDK